MFSSPETMEEGGELEFIATPLMGHIVAMVELAKNLVSHNPQISIAVHIIKLPFTDANLDSYLRSASSSSGDAQISLLELPPLETPPDPEQLISKPPVFAFNLFAGLYKPVFKRLVQNRSRRVIGIVTDMLIPHFVDVADEIGVPSYALFTSGANMLAMMLRLESLGIDVPSAFADCAPESAPVEVPGFRTPIPISVWPEIFFHKENSPLFLSHASRYRKMKGILVNTFVELEEEILLSLCSDDQIPAVYAVGPVLDLGHRKVDCKSHPIIDWLDEQPPASVVFLCFGSIGSFSKEQVEQIAIGIEQSGHRFLWSLRRQPNPDKGERLPSDYDDFNEVLPAGFLDRTSGIGKMIGWAPQAEVLAHSAVGAFVSHCGWNSVLESLWFGVPVVAWPMYAEQQLNAFCMVKELGIAVELRIDYKYNIVERNGNMVVTAEEVERGIRKMMEKEEGAVARVNVEKMSQIAKRALDVGRSSHKSLERFVQTLIMDE